MTKKILLLTSISAVTFILGFSPFLVTQAYAVEEGDLIGGTCEQLCVNKGAISLVSQTDGGQTLIGDPTTNGSLAGLAFDASGTLWGSNNIDTSPFSPFRPITELIQIDPDTATQVGPSIPLTFNGRPATVQDLAVQPGTDVLFASSHFQPFDFTLPRDHLVTIDKSTGVVTDVGLLPPRSIHAIGFDPNTGTLYDMRCGGTTLLTINPVDASVVSSINLNQFVCVTGLGVRSDGIIFTSGLPFNNSTIFSIDPTTGVITTIGSGTPDAIADLAFVRGSEEIAKTVTSGPDNDGDGEIDVVVEVGQLVSTEYDFDITYSNRGGPGVLITDTVPAEWQVTDVAAIPIVNGFGTGNDGNLGNGTVDVAAANNKTNNKSATKIEWTPDPSLASSTINVVATTRQSPGKKNVKFRPTSCGALVLNDGAKVFELDPATGEPLLEPVTGAVLPPIFESEPLVLVAVEDLNGGGLVRDGSGDEDGDGLTDADEALNIGTDPCLVDTDGDGVNDNLDQCPLRGLEETGSVNLDGCPRLDAKTVFVTSTVHDGNLGGLQGADLICNQRANAAGLSGTYKAWLADSTGSPSTRFLQSVVPYVRTDGAVVATDWTDLTDGSLTNPINRTESGTLAAPGVNTWTNVTVSGAPESTFNLQHCFDWTSSSSASMEVGQVGRLDRTDTTWTDFPGGGVSCQNFALRLYCFEQ